MNRFLKQFWQLFAGLLCVLCPIAARSESPSASEQAPSIRFEDSTDWWSYTAIVAEDTTIHQQPVATAPTNFRILGITLDYDDFAQAGARLGRATVVTRGDAATGRSQVGYISAEGPERVHLIFEQGEVNFAFYLFVGGPSWTGMDLCTESPLLSRRTSTVSGLRLGLTPHEVETILGVPNFRSRDRLVYSRSVRKSTPPAELAKMRAQHSDVDSTEFFEDYAFFDQSVYIEARFSGSKLVYLAVSLAETD